MTNPLNQLPKLDISDARPVAFTSRLLAALSLLIGAVPIAGSAFLGWEWTADQVEAYTIVAGAVIGALASLFGVQVEKRVTPTARPRDDALNPLTPGPIGSDNPDELPPI